MNSSSSSALAQRPSSVRQVNASAPQQQPVQRFNAPQGGGRTAGGGASSIKTVKLASTGSTDYELTCKRALRLRIVRTLLFSSAATWSIASTTSYLTGGFHLLPSFASFFSVLVASLLIFAFAVLPTIVLRKSLLSQPEPTTTSLLSRISLLLSQPTTHTTTIVFLTCGVIQAFVWAVLTDVSKPEAKLGVFASTLKYPFHLNERLILVLLSNLSLGITYACRELLAEAFLPKWPSEMLPIPGLIIDRLVWLPFSLTLPVVHSAAFTAVYLSFRRPVFRFILSWFGIIARPHIANFLRRAHFPMDLGLFSRMIVLQSATVLGWEVAKAVLEVYMVQPMIISQTSSSPARCLLEGITSPSPYFRHHALFELSHLSTTSPSLRKAIFADLAVSPATGRTLWQEVWRSQMVLLGNSYQKLLARGASPKTVSSSSTASLSSSAAATANVGGPGSGSPSSGGRALKLKNDPSIFLKQPPSPASFLSSSSSSSNSLPPSSPSPAPRSTVASSASSSTVPSIFTQHSLPPPPPPTLAPAPRRVVASGGGLVSSVLGLAGKVWGLVWGLVPKEQRGMVEGQLVGLRKAEGREVGRGVVRGSLGGSGSGKEEGVLAVQTLSSLISASLTEDPYGQVQRSIPQTLEALLSFHEALATFQVEATQGKVASALGEVEREEMRLVVLKEVGAVLDATREGIRQIVDTFGTHLSAFKMPVQVVKQWEGLMSS
ncbi:nucleoporin protein Ndc1-Nup-domain-containing protein [Mrakia frigida]|uniref:nucleoporin protein Ndc1-Nup-domain-containing protein n=1 Tax=Mrakia frigida TaxID=29902 RepID=UPI003FCBF40F